MSYPRQIFGALLAFSLTLLTLSKELYQGKHISPYLRIEEGDKQDRLESLPFHGKENLIQMELRRKIVECKFELRKYVREKARRLTNFITAQDMTGNIFAFSTVRDDWSGGWNEIGIKLDK